MCICYRMDPNAAGPLSSTVADKKVDELRKQTSTVESKQALELSASELAQLSTLPPQSVQSTPSLGTYFLLFLSSCLLWYANVREGKPSHPNRVQLLLDGHKTQTLLEMEQLLKK